MRAYEECLARARHSDGTNPADRRRLRQPDPLPQRPQHHPHAVRMGLPAHHQRERHRERRRNPLRRQRPPRGDGHEPVAGTAADSADQRRWPVFRRPERRSRRRSSSHTVPYIDRRSPGHGRRQPERAGLRRNEEQAARAARLATAAGESVIMANGSTPGILDRDLRRRAGRHALPAARQQPCRRGSAGSASRPGPSGQLVVDAGARRPYSTRVAACCRSAWCR